MRALANCKGLSNLAAFRFCSSVSSKLHYYYLFCLLAFFQISRVIHISINKLEQDKQTEEGMLTMLSPSQNNAHEYYTYYLIPQPGEVISPTQGHLAISGDIFGYSQLRKR